MSSLSSRHPSIVTALKALDEGRTAAALEVLEPLRRRFPRDEVVLRALSRAYFANRDLRACQDALEVLVEVTGDADARYLLATVYVQNGYTARALDIFEKLGARDPGDPRAAQYSKMREATDEVLARVMPEVPAGLRRPRFRSREDVRYHLERNDLSEARKAARRHLQQFPDDVSGFTLTAQIELADGQPEPALGAAGRALQQEPGNLFAQAAVVRARCLQGDFAAAEPIVLALRDADLASDPNAPFEISRALAHAGDGLGSVALAQWVEAHLEASGAADILAAGAAAIIAAGHPDKGRAWLQQALEIDPGHHPARENLEDLDRPPGLRNGPYAVPFEDWLGRSFLKLHLPKIERLCKPASEKRHAEMAAQLLQLHPPLERLLPALLQRGEPLTRQFALALAGALDTPAARDALRAFVQSQAGPDGLRWETAIWLRRRGALETNRVHFWHHGEWRDMLVMSFQLRDDPPPRHRPGITEMLDKARHLYDSGQSAAAEEILRQALQRDDSIDAQMALATVLLAEASLDEAAALLEQAPRDHGHAIALRLELLVATGRMEQATALMADSLSRTWNASDFARFCDATIRLNVAVGESAANDMVQSMRRRAVPDGAYVPWTLRL